MAWTDDNVAALRRMWNEEETATAIASALGGGMTRNSVIAKANRLGLPARRGGRADAERFDRIADRVIDAPYGRPMRIRHAATLEGMDPELAQRIWDRTINATHGGEPQL